MIIWAASWPRSGSTLFRIVWHSYTGLPTFSYANDPILANGKLAPFLGQKPLPHHYKQMQSANGAKGIYLIKTHLYAGEHKDGKKLLVIRDVRDAIVSLAHYTSWRKRRDFDLELARIVEQSTWAAFNNSWNQHAQVVVKYEDIKAGPLQALRNVLEGLGVEIPITDKPLPEFETLHSILPRFFRRGIEGGWREVLTEAQEQTIWERNGQYMEMFGYERGQR